MSMESSRGAQSVNEGYLHKKSISLTQILKTFHIQQGNFLIPLASRLHDSLNEMKTREQNLGYGC